MVDRNQICKACDGIGLLADDENWQYNCTICGGTGILKSKKDDLPNDIISVDEMNRILE